MFPRKSENNFQKFLKAFPRSKTGVSKFDREPFAQFFSVARPACDLVVTARLSGITAD